MTRWADHNDLPALQATLEAQSDWTMFPLRAVLTAGSPAALRAYAALGFEEIGRWRVVLFRTPQVMP